MRKARDTLLSLTLLGLVFTGPAAVAAYLLSSGSSEAPLMLAAVDSQPAASRGPHFDWRMLRSLL